MTGLPWQGPYNPYQQVQKVYNINLLFNSINIPKEEWCKLKKVKEQREMPQKKIIASTVR